MVTLSPRDADREVGDWVIWMSHLAPEMGKLKTNSQLVLIRELIWTTDSNDYTQLNNFHFLMLSSLPASQSSSKPRSWLWALMSVLCPVYVRLTPAQGVTWLWRIPQGRTVIWAYANQQGLDTDTGLVKWLSTGLWSNCVSNQRGGTGLFIGISSSLNNKEHHLTMSYNLFWFLSCSVYKGLIMFSFRPWSVRYETVLEST